MTRAANTFAQKSDDYALARPRYPRALYDWILGQCRDRDAAWDCATGNGQAAVDLAPHFGCVQATDLSREQVQHGMHSPNIVYSAQPAERTDFADGSFDLVTVAQALHWFDYGLFWNEVARVCRPGALFCAWGYAWFDCDAEVDRLLVQPFRQLIGSYWAPNNRILWDGYQDQDIAFPFARLAAPRLAIRAQWTVPQLIAYMQTWSSYKRSQGDAQAARELAALADRALTRFADLGPLDITMPLAVVAGHVDG